MVRDSDPDRLVWWKSSDRLSAWAKVSAAAVRCAADRTGANTTSDALGAMAETKRTMAQPTAKAAKPQAMPTAAPCPAASRLTAAPSTSGARTPSALPASVMPMAPTSLRRSCGALER